MTIPVNFPQPKKIIGPTYPPELWDLLNLVKRDVMNTINCVQIGKIESYVALTNTAEVSINSKKILTDGSQVDYPKLGDVPVFILCGSDSFISCPIAKGDDCIVLFNDRSIDNWYLSGQVLPPSDIRSHSLSDGIAIVGIKSLKSTSLKPVNSVCVNGGSKKVSIKNSATDLKTLMTTLVTHVQSLIDLVSGLTIVDTGTPTVPAGTWPVLPATQTSLAALKTTLTTYKTTMATLLDEGTV